MRAALFIDGSNIYYTEKTLGWEIDFRKVFRYFEERFAIYNAFYYAAEPGPEDDDVRRKYQEYTLSGYTLRLKKLKEIRDARGKIVARKANLDIEMIIDMFNTREHYDLAVLFTGDSDFVRAVELLRTHGKQVFVFSTKGHSSMELINAADKFFDFVEMKNLFSLEKEAPRQSKGNGAPGN